MKVSELCAMIQDSIRSGRYPLATETEKKFAGAIQVMLKSGTDDLKAKDIAIEVRVHDLYVVSNYVPNIQHLPGVIEAEIVDSYKMICRKIDRLDSGVQLKKL
ncbi:hypothetical protein [Nitrososphaera viennensis]|uniref:Uncharacterized protein n=2 Tax=Nitrososphaera viennensis TaxID=1034015 RepID=A0A060HNC1_9ARCH|nr:hypothetical protein [Nitrososphaera viennensis]AIC15061.1 hypothetical protein NVIE_008420 [Nitrososphaera viennensis EN76]UVS69990.1 hypothetical protein NWT39_04185 [Nitrososphaera viennensis]